MAVPSPMLSLAASDSDMPPADTAPAALPEPVLIVDDATLAQAVASWHGVATIALDTEFMRTDTFYPILALVQVCTGAGIWLIDPLSISNWSPLVQVLADPKVVKVLHSCSEDLEVLAGALGQLPAPLFDSQVAAALTGHGFSKGYSALVKELLGVDLAKHETRSDWLQRPLSAAQVCYAAEDVHYLIPVYRRLAAELAAGGRTQWLAEDMTARLLATGDGVPSSQYYTRIKGAGRLDRRGLAILQHLAAWRETAARRDNRPRSHLLTDANLLDIATHKPKSWAQLAGLSNLHPRSARRYGQLVVDTVNDVLGAPETSYPELLPAPLPRESEPLLKACRQLANTTAEALKLAPEMLVRRADIEYLVRSHQLGQAQLPPSLATGWRAAAIGGPLLHFINEQSVTA